MAHDSFQGGALHGGLGSIFAALAAGSKRPRYAFLVLQLVSEVAGEGGRAGPFIPQGPGLIGLRDWLCTQLLPMSERHKRRAALQARVVASLHDQLNGHAEHDEALIAAAVEEQVLAVRRAM